MDNQETTETPDKKRLGGSFVKKLVYGASSSIIFMIGNIMYQLYPDFFFKYFVFFLFLLAIGAFSFFLPAKSGFIHKYKKLERAREVQRVEVVGKFIGKRILRFIPGAEMFVIDILTLFLQNPTITIPVFMPVFVGIVGIFNTVIDYFSDTFNKLK